jgi:tetratricopeptide (TPR) repeat protein
LARKQPNRTAETLREIEETGDRVASWASEHAAIILGAIAAALMLAAAVGLYVQHGSSSRNAAADALAVVTREYRQAMGADPAGGPVPEPANPELAVRTRSQFAERYAEIARSHVGTPTSALAWLEAGELQVELDRRDQARESFEAARKAAGTLPTAALASIRLAGLDEDRGDPAAAAQAYEAAAAVQAYPLRADALVSAARCWVSAGAPDKALAAFQRMESEYPDEPVAPQVESLIAELRVRRAP